MTRDFLFEPLVQEQLPEKFCIFSHHVKTRTGLWMSQQRFWCHKDKRLAEWEGNLASQDVEVVCWCRAVGNLKYTYTKAFQLLITFCYS